MSDSECSGMKSTEALCWICYALMNPCITNDQEIVILSQGSSGMEKFSSLN